MFFFCEFVKRSCDVAERLDEHAVEVDETDEPSDFRHCRRCGPGPDGLNLGGFHAYLSWRDFVAEEDRLLNVELALVSVD